MSRKAIYTTDGAVARLTLNDPDSLNAWTPQMCQEILEAISSFTHDDDRRVLVVTGAGGAFCAGGNLNSSWAEHASGRQLGHAIDLRENMHAVALALHRLDKPAIAMINGAAVSGGLVIAMLCDFRVASDRAVLGDPSGRVGLLPDEGGAWLWPRLMGQEEALRMVLLNEVYDANRAQALGLVGEVVSHEELEGRVGQLADQLARRAPLAVRIAKTMIRQAAEQSLEQHLHLAELAVTAVNDTADVAEGVEAFKQKREPVFGGRRHDHP